MKVADLHNGIRAAARAVHRPSRHCTRRSQAVPIARIHPHLSLPVPVRTFASSTIRRAEDEPSSSTTSHAKLADAAFSGDAGVGINVDVDDDDAPAFTAAPEIDLRSNAVEDGTQGARAASTNVTESLSSRRSRQHPPTASPSPSPARRSRRDRDFNGDMSRLRVVPASPSYFTSRPNFTDHYLDISALYRRHQLLPSGGRSETKVTWLSLPEYKALIGDEPVAAGRYRELISMCQKLSNINPHLLPDEVAAAIARFMKEEQPRVKYTRQNVVDEHGRAYGLGRRKAATARAWIVRANNGDSNVLINGKSLSQYFSRITQRESAIYALAVTERVGDYNVWGVVEGGGTTGQAEALTLAVAKALCVYEPDLTMRLKSAGCLTRDRRKVERKKPGHLKARKKPAWVKR